VVIFEPFSSFFVTLFEKSFVSEGRIKSGKLGGHRVSMGNLERNDCSIHSCCPLFNRTTFHWSTIKMAELHFLQKQGCHEKLICSKIHRRKKIPAMLPDAEKCFLRTRRKDPQ